MYLLNIYLEEKLINSGEKVDGGTLVATQLLLCSLK